MTTKSRTKPKAPPEGLRSGGRALWRAVVGVYALRADEVRVLDQACRSLDLCQRLAGELAAVEKLVTTGSRGQPAAHPLLAEVRSERLAFARLCRQLGLPDDVANRAGGDATAVTSGARELARKRWGRA